MPDIISATCIARSKQKKVNMDTGKLRAINKTIVVLFSFAKEYLCCPSRFILV